MPQSYATTSVSPELANRLRAMPKAEIHVHIEGATNAATFYQLAQRNRVELPVRSLEECANVKFRWKCHRKVTIAWE